jgi:hypothetical protein
VKSYCTSFYGAEVWDLSHNGIEAICIAWRKGIRRIWRLPNTTHSVLIPELCETLPLVDMFYKRMLNFVYRCLNSQSSLVNFVARFGILSGQMDSVVGRNVLNCSLRYNTSIDRILRMEFASRNINRFVVASQVESDISAILLELLQCRDGSLTLSNDNFNVTDIAAMIDFLCTG